ncbi:hypothetical protein Cgig2_016623 [Carnegiea gigantea]|uniref:TF-B3 domain-containing protein n=1 Tax=Carnegiea gigantea TaxID=171969 RepID=A0A9Q1L0T2_9CARY|nr:hypothetical protein Cgig2_016623 [Carnegiea gigantea]
MEGGDVFMKDHGINSNHSGASGCSSLVFSYAGNSTFKVACASQPTSPPTQLACSESAQVLSMHDQPNGNNNVTTTTRTTAAAMAYVVYVLSISLKWQEEDAYVSIPEKFAKYFKGESLSGWWSLRGPNGKQWMVQIKRIQDETVFSEGWGSFVKDHRINPGDTLIFTYSGNSSFQVSIFNSNGCEREVAHFPTHSGSGSCSGSSICCTALHPHHKMNIDHNNNQSDDHQETRSPDGDLVEIIRDEHQTPRSEERRGPSCGIRTRRRTPRAREDNEHQIPGSSSLFSSKMCSSESDNDEEMSNWSEWRPSEDNDVDDDASVEIIGTRRTPRVEDQTPRSEDKEPSPRRRTQGSSSQGRRRKTVYISNRRPMTQGENKRALALARSFMLKTQHSGIPAFQITMLHNHVYHTFHVTIPRVWAQEHMVGEYDKVELRVPEVEGSWVVRRRWSNLRHEYELTRQWKMFVLDNNVEEHDVCVFQLVKKGRKGSMRRAIFNVDIFRVVEQVVPLTIFKH